MTVYQERRFYFKGKKAIEYWADIDYGVYLQVHESQRRELFTTPPAQLLRPVKLPEPYDDGHGNLWLPQDAVISAVKNAGGEVKND